MGAQTIFDVIVVGAGPAGSTTAYECAIRGLTALLLDKVGFPRDKPCGGGITFRTAALLAAGLPPVTERTITAIEFTLRHKRGFTRSFPEPLVYMTQRRRFDAWLVERALAAGATLRERTAVRAVEQQHHQVVVRSDNETFIGRTLVAADGANGPTARLAGLAGSRWLGIALEGNIALRGGVPENWAARLGINIGSVPGGYGWLFPKGDHLNFGVYAWRPAGPDLRSHLAQLVQAYGFDPADLRDLRGHHLPVRTRRAPLASGNVLLAGDAAGLIDPFTGEGIYGAVCSGRLAAEQIAAYIGGQVPDLRGYSVAVEAGLCAELEYARQMRDALQLSPTIAYMLLRWTAVPWTFLCRLIRDETPYAAWQCEHGALRAILAITARLARSAPLRRRAAIDCPVVLPLTVRSARGNPSHLHDPAGDSRRRPLL